VGRAGKLLTQMIEAMGSSAEDVYICNVVKCRPPEIASRKTMKSPLARRICTASLRDRPAEAMSPGRCRPRKHS